MSVASLTTPSEIARRLGKSAHRIAYVIKSRKIQPIGWAGHARIFGDDAIAQIESELRLIDAAKLAGRRPPVTTL